MAQGRHRQVRRGRGAVVAAAVVVVVGAASAIAVAASRDSAPSQTQSLRTTVSATPSSAGPSPTASATTTHAATRPNTKTSRKPAAKPPTLAVTVTGAASYVEVRLPDRSLLVGNTFGHGKRFTFTQPTLDVVIGDAGAVRLDINGVAKSPAGKPGQVLKFRVTARR